MDTNAIAFDTEASAAVSFAALALEMAISRSILAFAIALLNDAASGFFGCTFSFRITLAPNEMSSTESSSIAATRRATTEEFPVPIKTLSIESMSVVARIIAASISSSFLES